MTKIGYACMLEQFHPTDLLDWAEQAEGAGFDAGFQVSEHFHPWTPQQGQSAFAWSFMGALGQRTSLPFGTAVTCPGFRYHPAVIAHAEQVGASQVEVTQQAEDDWIALLQTGGGLGFLGNPDCTPGYYNNEGKPAEAGDRLNMCGYPQGPMAYFDFIDAWRRSGDFEGLELRTEGNEDAPTGASDP